MKTILGLNAMLSLALLVSASPKPKHPKHTDKPTTKVDPTGISGTADLLPTPTATPAPESQYLDVSDSEINGNAEQLIGQEKTDTKPVVKRHTYSLEAKTSKDEFYPLETTDDNSVVSNVNSTGSGETTGDTFSSDSEFVVLELGPENGFAFLGSNTDRQLLLAEDGQLTWKEVKGKYDEISKLEEARSAAQKKGVTPEPYKPSQGEVKDDVFKLTTTKTNDGKTWTKFKASEASSWYLCNKEAHVGKNGWVEKEGQFKIYVKDASYIKGLGDALKGQCLQALIVAEAVKEATTDNTATGGQSGGK